MLKQVACAAAALTIPGVGMTVASERLIRPRVFYHNGWHPDPPHAVDWPHEEATIYTADGLELQGWLFKAAQPGGSDGALRAPTLLFMHGTSYNASDMWVTEERATAFHDFLEGIGANFFIFDYRGYGKHKGETTEEATYTDAAAALGWLYARHDIDPTRIFFYGFSLGTGVATGLAMREGSAGLILRAPFTSIRGMATARHPWMASLFTMAPWLPLTNYDNLRRIRRLDRPLLVMHGSADETVPEYMGQQVFEAAPDPKMYVSFPGRNHSDISTDLVVPAITQFVDGVLSGSLRR